MPERLQIFLSYAFRPFFLLNGVFAVVIAFLWIMMLHGVWQGPANLMSWHAHEMLVGFVMAAMSGFLLTAIATWTGRPPIAGRALGWLVVAWLGGRVVMTTSGTLPTWVVAPIDLAFPLLLFLLVLQQIATAGNRRNYPLIAITAVLVLLTLLYHLGAAGVLVNAERAALYLMTHTILLLITIIGGRVIPNFTANWLRSRGHTNLPGNNQLVDRLTILSTGLVGIAASLAPLHPVTAILALCAAILHTVRLFAWRGLATRAEPLLLMLHVAYAWLPIGYILVACSTLGWLFPPTASLHALTMGAMGSMVLAMITRVPLGHTGRPLHASPLTAAAYAVLTIAVAVRVLSSLAGPAYQAMIDFSAAGWMLAFTIFSIQYWPILTRPRVS